MNGHPTLDTISWEKKAWKSRIYCRGHLLRSLNELFLPLIPTLNGHSIRLRLALLVSKFLSFLLQITKIKNTL